MSEILKQLLRSRQRKVEVNGFEFTIERPTDIQAAELHANGGPFSAIVQAYVLDWANVKGRDIVPSTKSDDPVPFEKALWREWCADHPELWAPIWKEVMGAYQQHAEARDQSVKP